MEQDRLVRVPVDTHLGPFLAGFSATGLADLDFPGRHPDNFNRAKSHPLLASVKRCLKKILSGRQPEQFPEMDLSAGTPFQQSVWQEMLKIPMGQTLTYGEIAENLNNPGAVRAVGMACGANPIPVIIPCHRVLAAGGKIGGFSSGLEWKYQLLKIEGLAFL